MNKLRVAKTKSGNEIFLTGDSKAKVLVVGVVHGDEPQGKFLIEEYLKSVQSPRLLFIPCLNPDGMRLERRTNANGIDLNRSFPTQNWGKNEGDNATCDDSSTDYYGGNMPASEVETQFLINIIDDFTPEVILTLHAPYKVVNYDGPAEKIAERISSIIQYPVEASIGYPTPGSLGTYAGVERNIKTITLELDEECPVETLLAPVHKIFDYLSRLN